MGIFSSLLASNDPSQSGTLSPGTQGLLALSQALFKAGQPSRIPVNTGAALGGAFNEAMPVYATTQSRQNITNSLQKGDLQGTMQSMLSSPDPQLQNLGLSTKMNQMTPEYQMKMAAMKGMLDANGNLNIGSDGNGSPSGSGAGTPGIAAMIQSGKVTGNPKTDFLYYVQDTKGYLADLAKANAPTDLAKDVSNPATRPYKQTENLLTTLPGGRKAPVSNFFSPQATAPSAPVAPNGQPNPNIMPNGQPDNATTIYGDNQGNDLSNTSPSGVIPQTFAQQNDPSYQEGLKADAVKNADNLSDAKKQYNVAQSNMPRAFQRFQQIRDSAKDASSGIGVDEDGGGHAVEFAQSFAPKTALANQIINTATKQGILSELGPQLTGMRPNKFLESIASGASGLNLRDPAPVKANAVNMLQDQYVANLKAAAAQRRSYGDKTAPADADIDREVMRSYPTKVINGVKYYNVRGQWHQE